jgi:predicted alpha/beta-hydrolase family hydrolase
LSPAPEFLVDGPSAAAWTVALAHGAGEGMHSPFLSFFAKGLAGSGYRVVRFEFPYMTSFRQTGKRKPPDRENVLRETWHQVVEQLGRKQLVIGGRSMGGRIASLIAAEASVPGLICLGYPFHPIGQPEKLRVEHLRTINTPTLIVQGDRDPFGSWEEVIHYHLPAAIQIEWVMDGHHSFMPRRKSGRTTEQNWQAALDALEAFVKSLTK